MRHPSGGVYRHPADPWVAVFVGDAVLLPDAAENDTVTTTLGRIPLAAPAGGSGPTSGSRAGTVLLRPEQLHITEAAPTGIDGKVIDVWFYGHDAMITIRVDRLDASVDIRVPGPVTLRPGEQTGIRVTGEATLHS